MKDKINYRLYIPGYIFKRYGLENFIHETVNRLKQSYCRTSNTNIKCLKCFPERQKQQTQFCCNLNLLPSKLRSLRKGGFTCHKNGYKCSCVILRKLAGHRCKSLHDAESLRGFDSFTSARTLLRTQSHPSWFTLALSSDMAQVMRITSPNIILHKGGRNSLLKIKNVIANHKFIFLSEKWFVVTVKSRF